MDRMEQKGEILVRLGILFAPVLEITAAHATPSREQRTRALARYADDVPKLIQEFRAFAEGEPGHRYEVEAQRFSLALQGLISALASSDVADLNKLITSHFTRAREAVHAVPVDSMGTVLEAGSPFSAYCRLRDIIEAEATNEIVLVDAYVDDRVFHRFLRAAGATVRVVLVTSTPTATASSKDKRRWTEFLDTSRLFAAERGPSLYRLVVHAGALHDRWLLIDQARLFQLGGSVKDAGTKDFTISEVGMAGPALQTVQTRVSSGVEYFGVSTPTHQ